jgi:hypothetical protein
LSPSEVFLIAALTGLGAYAAWVTKAYIAHLLADIAGLNQAAHRGTAQAEKAVDRAEQSL